MCAPGPFCAEECAICAEAVTLRCVACFLLQNIAFAAKPDAKQVHVLSSGLKAAATWTRVEVLQNCRCGMHGGWVSSAASIRTT